MCDDMQAWQEQEAYHSAKDLLSLMLRCGTQMSPVTRRESYKNGTTTFAAMRGSTCASEILDPTQS